MSFNWAVRLINLAIFLLKRREKKMTKSAERDSQAIDQLQEDHDNKVLEAARAESLRGRLQNI